MEKGINLIYTFFVYPINFKRLYTIILIEEIKSRLKYKKARGGYK